MVIHPVRAGRALRCLIGASCLALLAAGCATEVQQGSPSAVRATPVAADPYQALVLHDGDRVTASGRVVAVPGKPVRFCGPAPDGDVAYLPGREPAPAYCELGVDVTGVDLATLARPRTKDGATEGYAELTGSYRDQVLTVTKQGPPSYPNAASEGPDQPPCPAPAGGWPRGPSGENINVDPITAYRNAHPGAIVTLAMLRPSDTQVIAYALTVGDPTPVRTALAGRYHGRLCVAQSPYNRAQIDAARHAIDLPGATMKQAGFLSSGEGLTHQGAVELEFNVVRVTPELARLAAAQPPNLIKLTAWLAPS